MRAKVTRLAEDSNSDELHCNENLSHQKASVTENEMTASLSKQIEDRTVEVRTDAVEAADPHETSRFSEVRVTIPNPAATDQAADSERTETSKTKGGWMMIRVREETYRLFSAIQSRREDARSRGLVVCNGDHVTQDDTERHLIHHYEGTCQRRKRSRMRQRLRKLSNVKRCDPGASPE
jgi:hypothetical protein